MPRTRRGVLLTIVGGVVAVAIGGFLFIYFVLFPTSSPKPFTLVAPKTTAPVSSGTHFAGNWTIGKGSLAGYRVREKLAFLPAQSEAVGRTSAITGTATFTQTGDVVKATAAAFKVKVIDLKSDSAMRDQHIQTIGLQSATYPNATFKLSTPLTLPASAIKGGIVHTSVTGVFNIHGTSRQVTMPLQMRLTSSQIDAVGSLTFPWAKFGMTAPSVGGFVSVTDQATMEFDLHLTRAG